MVDKGAEEREEIYVAWYEGEPLEEWNEMKTGKKVRVNIRETFLIDLLDRWANLPNKASSPPEKEWVSFHKCVKAICLCHCGTHNGIYKALHLSLE